MALGKLGGVCGKNAAPQNKNPQKIQPNNYQLALSHPDDVGLDIDFHVRRSRCALHDIAKAAHAA